MIVRPTISKDIPALEAVLDGTGLFPSEMLADMMGGYLSEDDGAEVWLTVEAEGEAIGFCFAVPEKLADGAWNMLAIAVLPDKQGSGAGGAIVAELERRLRGQGQRILIAETSSAGGFAQTREFYRKNDYVEEARIRDFWAAGDDKVIFWKAL